MTDPLQNSILRISDEKTMQLLTLYEQEPCLWDTTQAEYRSRHYNARHRRAKAAERIARKLQIKHFEPKHVMIKFKNLRNSYCQELKKMAGFPDYQPRVFWFSKMDSFLRPHMQSTRGPIVANSFSHSTDESQKEDERSVNRDLFVPSPLCLSQPLEDKELKVQIKIEEDDAWMHQSHQEEEDIDVSVDPPIRSSVSSDDDAPLAKTTKRRRQHGREQPAESSSEQQSTQALLDFAAQLKTLCAPREDALDAFGRYVASLLRAMPPARAAQLQPRVVALLTAADDDRHVSQSDQNV